MKEEAKEQAKKRVKTVGEKIKNIVLPVIAYGGIAGIFSGVLVGVFNFGARYLIEYSGKIYQSVLDHPWAIPLFFLGLAALAQIRAQRTRKRNSQRRGRNQRSFDFQVA